MVPSVRLGTDPAATAPPVLRFRFPSQRPLMVAADAICMQLYEVWLPLPVQCVVD